MGKIFLGRGDRRMKVETLGRGEFEKRRLWDNGALR